MRREIHGPLLRDLRLGQALTQTALAARTGIPRDTISRLESGGQKGTPHQIKTLAEFFDVTIPELAPVPTVDGEAVA